MPTRPVPCYYVFVRHCERADYSNVPMRIPNPSDPPLSPLGVEQAIATGTFLKSYLSALGVQIVAIEASPMIRALMTASFIAFALSLQEFLATFMLAEVHNHDFLKRQAISDFRNIEILASSREKVRSHL